MQPILADFLLRTEDNEVLHVVSTSLLRCPLPTGYLSNVIHYPSILYVSLILYCMIWHALPVHSQCNENIIVNPGFEIVTAPCGDVGTLINGAFNRQCMSGWDAAWGTPSVCAFEVLEGNYIGCFGANNEAIFQDLNCTRADSFYFSFSYLNLSGEIGSFDVYLASGLVNQPLSVLQI